MYEQVVADFGLTAKHKWVVFGGSVLHGPMAAWFRLKVNRWTKLQQQKFCWLNPLYKLSVSSWKGRCAASLFQYPHLVIAAVASSAPVRAKVNLEYFNSAVADSFRDPHYGGSTQVGTLCSILVHAVSRNGQIPKAEDTGVRPLKWPCRHACLGWACLLISCTGSKSAGGVYERTQVTIWTSKSGERTRMMVASLLSAFSGLGGGGGGSGVGGGQGWVGGQGWEVTYQSVDRCTHEC